MLEHLYSRAQEHEGLGFWGLGFRGLGFRVLGFRVLGFRVSIAYWLGCENPDFQNPNT